MAPSRSPIFILATPWEKRSEAGGGTGACARQGAVRLVESVAVRARCGPRDGFLEVRRGEVGLAAAQGVSGMEVVPVDGRGRCGGGQQAREITADLARLSGDAGARAIANG